MRVLRELTLFPLSDELVYAMKRKHPDITDEEMGIIYVEKSKAYYSLPDFENGIKQYWLEEISAEEWEYYLKAGKSLGFTPCFNVILDSPDIYIS